jgi:hypothetical protein
MFKKLATTILAICVLNLTISLPVMAEMTLGDLGFKTEDLKVDPQVMQTLEVRHSKLQTHQKLGLATMGLMTATFLMGEEAKNNNIHKYLGIASGLMYWTTAYFSLSAPEVEGQKETGSSSIHKTLAWIHAPLMAIVPVLGYLAKEDSNKGKESKGLVKAHAPLATLAYASFMAAGLVMYFDFSF